MPSDAMPLPWDDEAPEEGVNGAPQLDPKRSEQDIRQMSSLPGAQAHEIPDGVRLAPGIEMDSDDPAAEAGRRRCVALNKAGTRCQVNAITDLVLCPAHAGRLDSSAGGYAKAEKLRLVREEAQNREIQARLGTRAIVASALAEKHEEIRAAIHDLADRAADGDRQCALALLPYMTQALGTPSPAQATQLPTEDGDTLDLSTLDTAQLRALLAPLPSE